MFEHKITSNFDDGKGDTLSGTVRCTGNGEINLSVVVPANANNYLIATAFTAASVVASYILASGDLTLETNNSTTPDDLIPLQANEPDIGRTFSEDVTAVYATNAASTPVTLSVRILRQVTA